MFSAGAAQRSFRHFGKAQPVRGWYRLKDEKEKKQGELLFMAQTASKAKKQNKETTTTLHIYVLSCYCGLQSHKMAVFRLITVVEIIRGMFGLVFVKVVKVMF